MFYKQGSFAGRIVPSEASAAYQPQVNWFQTVYIVLMYLLV